MNFSEYFPVFSKLTKQEQLALTDSVTLRKMKKGTVIHGGDEECIGLLVIRSGQLRSFIFSEEGREITVYRLFDHDICLFTASCVMKSIQFDVTVSAEKDTDAWIVQIVEYQRLMENSAVIANYTNEIMASRFTDVRWLVEQIM